MWSLHVSGVEPYVIPCVGSNKSKGETFPEDYL